MDRVRLVKRCHFGLRNRAEALLVTRTGNHVVGRGQVLNSLDFGFSQPFVETIVHETPACDPEQPEIASTQTATSPPRPLSLAPSLDASALSHRPC
jgi:hypothetical protein